MSNNLITKYRPQTLNDVIGQPAIVKSLATTIKMKDSQVFLFGGPSGCGKTTLSRIVARAYGVDDKSMMEIDAASKTGVEDMRNLQDIIQYRPFGDSGMRAVILDECHSLSKQAFDSLLKALEDPPKHIVWFFCTTNPAKIPKTLQMRCTKFELKEVSDKDLETFLNYICDEEKIDPPQEVFDLIIKEAKGAPRQLLSNLVVARSAKNRKEAAELLRTVVETDASLELCRFVADGNGSWGKAMGLLDKLEGTNPESIRILMMNYLGKCLKSAKDDKTAIMYVTKLDGFSIPYTGTDGMAPLLLSIGRAILSE